MPAATYIWAKVLGFLEERLSSAAVSAMLDDAELVELNDKALVIYSPSEFRQEAIRKNYKSHVEDILRSEFQLPVSFEVWGDEQFRQSKADRANLPLWTFHPHFHFSSFIPGTSNPIPLRAAMHVAEHPGDTVYNPLYLYGPPGVGKTHLIYAIASHIAQRRPEATILCIKGEQFTSELIQAIAQGATAAFKTKYRNADILLVDDIQFMVGKEATQEEFFHTFNALYEQGKQIVLTCDQPPGDLHPLQDRLKGRFGEGFMVKLVPPDAETRALIIRAKAKDLGLSLSDEVIDYLTARLCDNVRQIEGGLRKILAFRDLSEMRLTLENIAKILEDVQSAESAGVITPDLIMHYVCKYYNVEQDSVRGRQRSKNISVPRQMAMYLIRTRTACSLEDIGKYFNRDHSTVKYALRSVESALTPGSETEAQLRDITANIEARN